MLGILGMKSEGVITGSDVENEPAFDDVCPVDNGL